MSNEKKVQTLALRETLKVVMQKEIEKLPEVLEKMEPKDRLLVLCKLMPFIFPKVDSLHFSQGER